MGILYNDNYINKIYRDNNKIKDVKNKCWNI